MDVSKLYTKDTIPPGTMAWGVPVLWLSFILEQLMKQEPDKKSVYFCIRDRGSGKVLDPRLYELFVEGVDFSGNRVWLEDIPPEPIG